MERGLWIGVGAALVLLSGCFKSMSYDEQDAARVNAINALVKANSTADRVEHLEFRVEELEAKLAYMEQELNM